MQQVTSEASGSSARRTLPDDSPCPCGSGGNFDSCCGPILSGTSPAATAEALMRSRYSAYVTGEIEHLVTSLHPEKRGDFDPVATRRWSQGAQWKGLQVISSSGGGEQDEQGEVEFIATYKEKGMTRPLHERASFQRQDGIWYYVDGEMIKSATSVHQQPKVGRNAPCPCGSGKKYKKCCGA